MSRTRRQAQRLLQTTSTGQINPVVHVSVNNHSVNVATPVNHAETCDPLLLAAGLDIYCKLLDLAIDKYGTLLGAVDSVVHIPEKFGKRIRAAYIKVLRKLLQPNLTVEERTSK